MYQPPKQAWGHRASNALAFQEARGLESASRLHSDQAFGLLPRTVLRITVTRGHSSGLTNSRSRASKTKRKTWTLREFGPPNSRQFGRWYHNINHWGAGSGYAGPKNHHH